MNVLVIGNGGREHAIAWKLSHSPQVEELFVAPGNAGTGEIAENLSIAATDVAALVDAARERQIDLTVVGPETPLAMGIVDRFEEAGLPIVGPSQAAARIESSKLYAKRLMQEQGIPTGWAHAFSSHGEAREYVFGASLPLVVKADGLASGKGVTVCTRREEALAAVHACMEARVFGAAGDCVLIEECLQGHEVSVFTFTDGVYITPLVAACDYKRALSGDHGPNTGGMGAYSPPSFWTKALADQVMETVMEPAIRALAYEQTPFRGVLYAGLMLTDEGPKVLEFNCRMGDPETQAVLPRLKTDLVDVLLGIVNGTLARTSLEWSEEACVAVVAASGGYPGEYQTGFVIQGLERAASEALVFHAGTQERYEGATGRTTAVTDGGRVLSVAALGGTVEEAGGRAYANLRHLYFQDIHYREDIASGATAPV